MKFKFELKNKIAKQLISSLVLSLVVCISSSAEEADFSYFNLANSQPLKLQKTISLDTSQTKDITPQNQTFIPFNLRGDFNEADYFSSEINETPPPKNIPPPQEKNAEDMIVEDSGTKENTFAPSGVAENFFSPVVNVSKEKLSQEKTSSKEVLPKLEDINKDVYAVTANSNVQVSDSDLEGCIINTINIEGLKTVSPNLVLSQLNTQSGCFFNTDLLQKDLQKIYATGYFSDNMIIEPTLNSDNKVDLTFILEENILVQKVSVKGNTVVSDSEINPYISPLKGLPQNLIEINKSIKNIQDCYHQKGYILASVYNVDDDAEGNLNFNIHEGIINKINISGNEKTKDYVIKRNIMTQSGTIYNEECLKKDLAKIYSTQIFDEVNRELAPSENNDGTYNVTVIVKEKSTNSIALGGGIDTGLGAFGSLSLREENFLGKAQKVSLTGILGSGILLSDASIKNHMNYQAELSFFEPHFINADNSLMSKLYFREMGSWQVPLAIERRVGLKTGIEHKVEGYDHLTTSFTLGAEHIRLKEGDFNRISELYAKNHLNIANRSKQLADGFFLHLSPGIKYSKLDDEEVPREGVMAQAQFIESVGITDFDHTNGRLSGAVTKFIPVFKKSSVSLTAKAGMKIHGDEMPEVMAYRLGGPYTIRGFRMNGVGSGDSFLMGSAELATPLPFVDKFKWDILKKMRFTFFIDTGKVFDPTISSTLYDRPLHAITAGVGLRLFIPGIGPMSIDYGLPLINPGSYGSENGYFTFGAGGLNMYNY